MEMLKRDETSKKARDKIIARFDPGFAFKYLINSVACHSLKDIITHTWHCVNYCSETQSSIPANHNSCMVWRRSVCVCV